MSKLVLGLVCALLLVSTSVAQPLTKWQSVKVASVSTEADDLVTLTLDLAGTELAESYETAGQYIQVRTSATAKGGFFALAAAPAGQKVWELLIKTGNPLTDELAALKAGARVEITPAQGSGFPLDEHKGQDVVILAMGSGISASRALLEQVLAHRADFGTITLIAGGRTPAHLAYRSRAEAWIKAGARVIFTISRPDAAFPWSGPTGYVQDQLTREMLTARPTALFAVGSKDMMLELTTKLADLGADSVKPITNF